MSEELPEAAAPVPAPTAPADTFFNHLPDYFQSHQIQASFRLLKQGIFVHEAAIDPLVEAYQAWTKKISPGGEGKTLEKCRKRLFGTEALDLFYVLDGNRCLPGVVLAGETADLKQSRIPQYHATLLPTKDFLHPRDPFLAGLENPKQRTSPQGGFILEFQLGGGKKIEVSESGLKEFAAALRSSPRARQANPDLTRALRYAITPVARFLSDARESPANQRILVPERFRGKTGLRYFRSHGMFLVVESDKKLIGCFSIKGKALGRFIRSEIEAMKGEMRGFVPGSPKKGCVGKCFSQGIAFHLHIGTLLQFLKQFPRVKKVSEKIPLQYSVRDLLERFGTLMRNSQPEDERNLLGKLRRRESFAKYRRTGNWVFVVLDKNVLTSCVYLRDKQAPSTSAFKPSA